MPRALLFSLHPDTAAALQKILEALGCQVERQQMESALWPALQSAKWDLVVYDAEEPPSQDFLSRVMALAPRAALWVCMDEGDDPAAGWPAGVRVFQKPVALEDFFKALSSSRKPAGAPVEEARVLVVHPDPGFCEGLLEFLTVQGHRARAVRRGDQALAEAGRERYHMVLADTSTPDIAPWDLANQLHQSQPNLDVLVLADHASIESVLQAMRADVFDYLLKPLDVFAFRRVLARCLEKQRMNLQIQGLLDGLKKANRDLSLLNELKSKFLRVVTHDLRTPLTSMAGFAQALQAGLIPPEKIPASYDTMVKECAQLEHLINDLTDSVGMESGKLRIDMVCLEPTLLFLDVVNRFRQMMERKGVQFLVEGLVPPLPLLRADPRRLDQVLTNFLNNALKFTPSGGKVSTLFRQEGERFLVRVEDTGVGLAPEHAANVFNPFFQVKNSGKMVGLGLGLSIAKEIVQGHGGQIGVESKGRGKGCSFWFSLPLELSASKGV